MKMTFSNTKTKLILLIIFAVIFYGVNILLYDQYHKALGNLDFKGKIEQITYDEKDIPDITVNKKRYHLTTFRKEFKRRVAVGDTIEKIKGVHYFKVFKEDSGDILKFGD